MLCNGSMEEPQTVRILSGGDVKKLEVVVVSEGVWHFLWCIVCICLLLIASYIIRPPPNVTCGLPLLPWESIRWFSNQIRIKINDHFYWWWKYTGVLFVCFFFCSLLMIVRKFLKKIWQTNKAICFAGITDIERKIDSKVTILIFLVVFWWYSHFLLCATQTSLVMDAF